MLEGSGFDSLFCRCPSAIEYMVRSFKEFSIFEYFLFFFIDIFTEAVRIFFLFPHHVPMCSVVGVPWPSFCVNNRSTCVGIGGF